MPSTPKTLSLDVIAHKDGGRPTEDKGAGIFASVQFLDHHVTENTLVTNANGAIYCGITCANEKANGGLLRSRDTCVIDDSSDSIQCDGNFQYNGTRFYAVIAKIG